jgi:hypothetical protein
MQNPPFDLVHTTEVLSLDSRVVCACMHAYLFFFMYTDTLIWMSLQVLCFEEKNSASMLTCAAVVRIRIPEGMLILMAFTSALLPSVDTCKPRTNGTCKSFFLSDDTILTTIFTTAGNQSPRR